VISDNIDIGLISHALQNLPIDIANINSGNQVVISGEMQAMPEAESKLHEMLGEERPFRFVMLNVSAPFHSRFMGTIVGTFGEILRAIGKGIDEKKSAAVTSNFRGIFHSGLYEDLVYNLISQLNHPVLWMDNMKALASQARTICEIGPSRPLRDFFKTINVGCTSITTLSAAEKSFAESG